MADRPAVLPWRWHLLIGATLLLVPADQLTKFLAVKHLTPGIERAAEKRGRPVQGFFDELGLFYGAVRDPCVREACTSVPVIDGFWSFHYVENRGAAWSLLAGVDSGLRRPFFFLTTAVMLGFVLYYLRRIGADKKRLAVALTLVFAGGIGNLIDRVYLGYVIDFVLWYAGDYHWPVFNVADSAISTGGVLLLLDVILTREKKPVASPATT